MPAAADIFLPSLLPSQILREGLIIAAERRAKKNLCDAAAAVIPAGLVPRGKLGIACAGQRAMHIKRVTRFRKDRQLSDPKMAPWMTVKGLLALVYEGCRAAEERWSM